MEIVILGTAAAEGWPAPFCTCRWCEEARRRGGPNVRARSGVLIDDDLKIDFGPDTVAQMQRIGRNLSKVRTILVTHQHADHLVPTELELMVKPYTQTPPGRVELFGNRHALAEIRKAWPDAASPRVGVDLKPIEAGDRFTTAAGDEVWALPADHTADAMLFRIRRRGKTYFHGHDSGTYPEATLDALAEGGPLDAVVMDCTNGGLPSDNRNHMGVDGVIRMADVLRRRNIAAPHTRLVATHFSHNGGMLHEELVRSFTPHGIETAFDGMVVRV